MKFQVLEHVHAADFPAYTLRQHSRTVGPRGDRRLTNIVVSQSADGSRVTQKSDLLYGMDERTIVHSDGLVQQVYDKIKVVSTTRESSPQFLLYKDNQFDPATNCLKPHVGTLFAPYKPVGQELLGTVPVFKILDDADTGSPLTMWKAPSLGCMTMKLEKVFPDSVSTVEFDGIWMGDTDSSVFAVPSDYQELIPSQAKFRLLKSSTTAISDGEIAHFVSGMAAEDSRYAAKRP